MYVFVHYHIILYLSIHSLTPFYSTLITFEVCTKHFTNNLNNRLLLIELIITDIQKVINYGLNSQMYYIIR